MEYTKYLACQVILYYTDSKAVPLPFYRCVGWKKILFTLFATMIINMPKKNRLLLNMALVYAILCMQVYTVSHRIDLPSCKFSSSPTLRYNEQATLHGHALFHKFRILFAGSKLVQESSSEWREQDRYKMLTRPWVG